MFTAYKLFQRKLLNSSIILNKLSIKCEINKRLVSNMFFKKQILTLSLSTCNKLHTFIGSRNIHLTLANKNIHLSDNKLEEQSKNEQIALDNLQYPQNRIDSKVIERQITNPESESVIVFPGQGSQFVGMGKRLLGYPGVERLYKHASEILKYDLLELCLYGPQSELNKTVYSQPAVFVTSIAAIEKLKDENLQGVENTIATAGFDVGEISAMVFAEMMSFEDGLHLVKTRAKNMQEASELHHGGMMTARLFWGSDLSLAIQAAKEHCKKKHNIEDPVCMVASYLFAEAQVIAGHEEALNFIAENHKDFGILGVKRLAVSGAFHTSMMDTARQPIKKAVKSLKLQKPKFKVYSAVTTEALDIDNKLDLYIMNQVCKPIKWTHIMNKLYSQKKDRHNPYTYECGPGNHLGTFLKHFSSSAYEKYKQIKV